MSVSKEEGAESMHQLKLQDHCRLCGRYKNRRENQFDKFRFQKDLQQYMKLSVYADDPAIHPAKFCNNCKCTLNRAKSYYRRTKSIKEPRNIAVFRPHSSPCRICDSTCSESPGKRSRPSEVSALGPSTLPTGARRLPAKKFDGDNLPSESDAAPLYPPEPPANSSDIEPTPSTSHTEQSHMTKSTLVPLTTTSFSEPASSSCNSKPCSNSNAVSHSGAAHFSQSTQIPSASKAVSHTERSHMTKSTSVPLTTTCFSEPASSSCSSKPSSNSKAVSHLGAAHFSQSTQKPSASKAVSQAGFSHFLLSSPPSCHSKTSSASKAVSPTAVSQFPHQSTDSTSSTNRGEPSNASTPAPHVGSLYFAVPTQSIGHCQPSSGGTTVTRVDPSHFPQSKVLLVSPVKPASTDKAASHTVVSPTPSTSHGEPSNTNTAVSHMGPLYFAVPTQAISHGKPSSGGTTLTRVGCSQSQQSAPVPVLLVSHGERSSAEKAVSHTNVSPTASTSHGEPSYTNTAEPQPTQAISHCKASNSGTAVTHVGSSHFPKSKVLLVSPVKPASAEKAVSHTSVSPTPTSNHGKPSSVSKAVEGSKADTANTFKCNSVPLCRFVNKTQANVFLCMMCGKGTGVACHPRLAPCGHLFCCDCILAWLDKNNTCPKCWTRMFAYQLSALDDCLVSLYDNLKVTCKYREQGCVQTVVLRDLKKHEVECSFRCDLEVCEEEHSLPCNLEKVTEDGITKCDLEEREEQCSLPCKDVSKAGFPQFLLSTASNCHSKPSSVSKAVSHTAVSDISRQPTDSTPSTSCGEPSNASTPVPHAGPLYFAVPTQATSRVVPSSASTPAPHVRPLYFAVPTQAISHCQPSSGGTALTHVGPSHFPQLTLVPVLKHKEEHSLACYSEEHKEEHRPQKRFRGRGKTKMPLIECTYHYTMQKRLPDAISFVDNFCSDRLEDKKEVLFSLLYNHLRETKDKRASRVRGLWSAGDVDLDEEPAKVPRNQVCGICHEAGHNRMTCTKT